MFSLKNNFFKSILFASVIFLSQFSAKENLDRKDDKISLINNIKTEEDIKNFICEKCKKKEKMTWFKKIVSFFKEDDFIRITRKLIKLGISTYFIYKFVLPDFILINNKISTYIPGEEKNDPKGKSIAMTLAFLPTKIIAFGLTQWLLI